MCVRCLHLPTLKTSLPTVPRGPLISNVPFTSPSTDTLYFTHNTKKANLNIWLNVRAAALRNIAGFLPKTSNTFYSVKTFMSGILKKPVLTPGPSKQKYFSQRELYEG